MLGLLIPLALKIGIPKEFAGKASAAATIMLAIAAGIAAWNIWLWQHDRGVINDHNTKAELKQVKRERKADTNLQKQIGRDEAASQQRREEIDHATQGIPDQAPSERQRARVCVELLRRGNAPPECHQPTR